MFFILSKILAFLYTPVIWITILLLFAIFRKRIRRKLIIAALSLLYVFSNEFIYAEFMRAWEQIPRPPENMEKPFDVAIVMGGHTTYDDAYQIPGFHDSSDRLLIALQLYRQGKVKKLLFTGGSAKLAPPYTKESEIISDYLLSIGIPEKDILTESRSKNTRENAEFCTLTLNEQYPEGDFLVITSGYHMRRSLKCFEKTGLHVYGFGVDRKAGPRKFYPDHLLIPSAGVLSAWSILLHEWIGYFSYWLMGYI